MNSFSLFIAATGCLGLVTLAFGDNAGSVANNDLPIKPLKHELSIENYQDAVSDLEFNSGPYNSQISQQLIGYRQVNLLRLRSEESILGFQATALPHSSNALTLRFL